MFDPWFRASSDGFRPGSLNLTQVSDWSEDTNSAGEYAKASLRSDVHQRPSEARTLTLPMAHRRCADFEDG
jgi:hypothetical protein